MSVGRNLGLLAAGAVSGVVATGIMGLIALDLLGDELIVKLWRSTSSEPAPTAATGSVLERLENYTFFTSIEAKEHGISVQTGVSYSTLADLLAKKHQKIWCYVMISPNGGLPRQINLGTQSRTARPVYTDLSAYPAGELAAVGLSARTLQALAKTHCVFADAAQVPSASTKGGRA